MTTLINNIIDAIEKGEFTFPYVQRILLFKQIRLLEYNSYFDEDSNLDSSLMDSSLNGSPLHPTQIISD